MHRGEQNKMSEFICSRCNKHRDSILLAKDEIGFCCLTWGDLECHQEEGH